MANEDPERTAPMYNIKAVARLTSVPADTLRRWESRYNIIVPERTESGYRLYSQRDVDTILWLKSKLDEGMSISRACDMLRHLGGDPGPSASSQPTPSAQVPQRLTPTRTPNELQSFDALRAALLDAFKAVDEAKAGAIVSDALSLYSIEEVCLHLLQPTLYDIGEGWLSGEVSVAVEHYSSAFVRARLENLFHSSPQNPQGTLAIVGCAPEELHEIGAMFMAVFMRRAGYRVVYLGQNVPIDSLISMVNALQPAVICISASRAETAASLYKLREFLDDMERRHGRSPLLAYGGQVFNRYPHITERLGGVYLGEDAQKALQKLGEHLGRRA
ncbi:MAG: MerR family transcriptional regulator [Chloroflexia bacterium]